MLLWTTSARAQFAWTAPPECPGEAEVQERLVHSLPTAKLPAVRAGVARRGAQLVLQLAIETAGHSLRRELRARECEPLVAGTVTLLALALRDAPAEVPVEGPVEAAVETPPLPALEPPAAVTAKAVVIARAAVASRTKPRPWTLRTALGAGFSSNGLPAARPDLSAKFGLQYSAFSLDLRVGHVFAATRTLQAEANARFVSQFIALSGCGQWGAHGLTAGPCLSMQGTRIHVTSRGLEDKHDHTSLWAQLGVGAGARYGFSRHAELGLEAGLLLPLSARPQFRVETLGEVSEGQVISGYGHFDVGVRFE